MKQFRGTTILSVRRNDSVVIGGDGQVTMGDTVMKGNARKVRRLYNDEVIAGFAGGTADAFTLFELFEAKLEEFGGQLTRAAVELAKNGQSGFMVTLEREAGDEYKCRTGTATLCDVTVKAKPMPDEYINSQGTFVTDAFLKYVRPLIGQLPKYVKLEDK